MQAQVVFIIDNRKEMSQKYKRILQQDEYLYPVICQNTQEPFEEIALLEPDIIIISDNIENNSNELCKKIRQQTQGYRPVIVVLSKSGYLEDKLETIRSGADDFLEEPIDPSEFSIRIFAHLRRHIEELSSPLTGFPNVNMTYKVLKRTVDSNEKWAMIYADINNIAPYTEIYGYLAAEKVLKAYAAIIKSAIDKGDFVGHLKDDNFIILTTPEKADKIAMFLIYAFDSVSSKFYASADAKRGYIIISGDEKAGNRVPIVTTSIGIISNQYRRYNNYQEAINAVANVHKMAKAQPCSAFVADRPKISTEEEIISTERKKKILIVETDAALAYLLTTTLEMQGYEVEATSNYTEIAESINKIQPDLILLDTGDKNPEKGLEFAQEIKHNKDINNIKLIVSTIIHDKTRVLDTGADLYLPKPYELMTLFSWVNRFLNI